MEESDSGQQPKRCPCGFWGSSQTSGLCSKCYKAYLQEKTQDVHDAKADLMRDRQSAYSNRDSLGATSSSYLATSCSQSSASDVEKAGELIRQAVRNSNNSVELNNKSVTTAKAETTSNTDTNTNPTEDSQKSVSPSTSQTLKSVDNTESSSSDSKSIDSGSVDNASKDSQAEVSPNPELLPTTPDRKGIKRDSSALDDCSPQSTPEKPGTKSKKRCNVCKCKLELAQRTIGRCRCDYVFCSLHRLPEQHQCEFDHKEDGRTEARKKMVKPTRHLGTSFKRLGSDS